MVANSAMIAIYLALAANICYSVAIVLYTSISHKTSVLWMNTVKGLLAFVCFLATVHFLLGWNPLSSQSLLCFFISGLVGLAFGDLCLLKAFTLIGPSRTMVLFGFQPLLMGGLAFLLFSQPFPAYKLIAIVFLMACLFLFSFERFKANREWGLKGIGYAFCGMLLDGFGILLTRHAFDQSPQIHGLEGNVYRCAGALLGFMMIGQFVKPIRLEYFFKRLSSKEKVLLLVASLLGTFMSLGFYLEAIKVGHLASVTAISVTGPLFSSVLEHAVQKRWPSLYFLAAVAMFFAGFYVLTLS